MRSSPPSGEHGRRLEDDWYPYPVPSGVRWGEGSWVYSSYAFRHCRSERPEAVTIGSNTGVYHPTQFCLGRHGSVVVGDHGTLVDTIISTNGRVEIGDLALVAHGVVIAGDPVAVPAEGRTDSLIRIGDNVWIGTKAVILDGADIGDDAVVGAGAVVDFVVPPGHLAAGNPGRVVRAID